MKYGLFLLLLPLFFLSNSFGQSLTFPAGLSDNRVDIGDIDIGENAITIEALVTMKPGAYNLMDIVCKHLDPTDMNYLMRSSQFVIKTNKGMAPLENPIKLCPNTTYHVAGTYDGAKMRYFVNGVEVASRAWTGKLFLNNNITAIGNMWNPAGDRNEQFRGYIDEVRIWKIARSQKDIASNMYNLEKPNKQPGLLAYYKFEGNYKNLQGNSAWNGKANRAQVSLSTNPYFKGAVSDKFCGGDELFVIAKKANVPVAKPIPPIVVPPLKPIPKVARTSPMPIDNITEPIKQRSPKPEKKPLVLKALSTPSPKKNEEKASTSTGNKVRIQIWDSDCMDYDSVSLKFNGKQIGAKEILLRLYKRDAEEFTYSMNLEPGENNFEISAIGEGVKPLVSIGLLIIYEDERKKVFYTIKAKETVLIKL